MTRQASFDLGGLPIRVRGRTAAHLDRLVTEWRAFVASVPGDPFLDVEVESAPANDDATPFGAKEMTARFDTAGARYEMPEGSAFVPDEGVVRIELGPTSAAKQFFALVNLLSAAAAWRLPSRGGAMLHAAGIVIDRRAFLLIGPEGSGKTTFALRAREGGADVLSDDVVVVLRSPGGSLDALATPFRSAQHGTLAPGRWPIAALLLPERGAPARLSAAVPLQVRARLLANLPFVAEALAADARAAQVVEDLVGSVPARTLAFAPDPSFVPLLRAFPTADPR